MPSFRFALVAVFTALVLHGANIGPFATPILADTTFTPIAGPPQERANKACVRQGFAAACAGAQDTCARVGCVCPNGAACTMQKTASSYPWGRCNVVTGPFCYEYPTVPCADIEQYSGDVNTKNCVTGKLECTRILYFIDGCTISDS